MCLHFSKGNIPSTKPVDFLVRHGLTHEELYIDASVKMKGQVVGGVRIRPVQPKLTKIELTPDHPRWDAAKEAIKNGKEKGVLAQFEISKVNLELLKK